ncbi:hypothetical protein HanXRQr2_Chr08g0346801 [Helianthus annuus]|uniref:Uncharacterized protein n=1 Tax=Helianthus annuus TaxID=4232 RepID=A0A251U6X4_HELAN|nr:hypothetical protein HanXRQr2_Chr08g0346801 [Helianthus annuus]
MFLFDGLKRKSFLNPPVVGRRRRRPNRNPTRRVSDNRSCSFSRMFPNLYSCVISRKHHTQPL